MKLTSFKSTLYMHLCIYPLSHYLSHPLSHPLSPIPYPLPTFRRRSIPSGTSLIRCTQHHLCFPVLILTSVLLVYPNGVVGCIWKVRQVSRGLLRRSSPDIRHGGSTPQRIARRCNGWTRDVLEQLYARAGRHGQALCGVRHGRRRDRRVASRRQ